MRALYDRPLAVLTALVLFAAPAAAGEDVTRSGWNGPNLPSTTAWGDTYAGSVSAASFRHGTYFYVERQAGRAASASSLQPNAKIADGRSRCAYEAGVCVIRP